MYNKGFWYLNAFCSQQRYRLCKIINGRRCFNKTYTRLYAPRGGCIDLPNYQCFVRL